MIARIEIAGFKRFTASCFELASLVVLCGLNGAGKSSMLQALLLCREAMTSQAKTVSLNGGPFGLELGTAEDVHNRASVGNISIRMMTADDPTVAQWRFAVPESTPDSLYLVVAERPDPFGEAFVLDAVPRGFTYLSAERFGPRALLKSAATAGSMLEVGVRGEFSAQVLAEFGERPLEYLDRRHPNAAMDAVPFLKYELEQWLSEIVCPIRVEPELHANGLVASLRFGPPGSDLVRAPNMGFGISYALPIILAGLVARPGGLLIVENPEAHLHPAGQSRIGVFLAWLAGKGVQVVLETHSDHVLNGICRAIAELGFLDHKNAIVHFFEGGEADQARVAVPLRFTASGGVSDWPPGFFDQYQIDVAALGRLRRRR
ncbi:DUF3696 domain-containing protein [Thiohalocapsa sp. ML1]|jgi:predicted ATPase|uniref:AAA family ATPase n=1 Tax=Thiohalocapsa sp. ML1 TaxID=1431688 RepID=UPI000731FC0F|nr:DUF3696 domain-containing protein [Thiohalocapsa sp. ML1]